MFRIFNLPVQILLIIVCVFFFGHWLPLKYAQFFYALSLSLKEILVFFLPFVIFSYLFLAIKRLGKGSLPFVASLIACICCSNFLSTMISYGIGSIFLKDATELLPQCQPIANSFFEPTWTWKLTPLLANEKALLLGILLGILVSYSKRIQLKWLEKAATQFTDLFLQKFFIPLVPVFILGFALKLQIDGFLIHIFKDYGPVIVLIFCAQFFYITLLYLLNAKFSPQVFSYHIRNMLPPVITGFTTMSSAAALPLNIQATQKNSHQEKSVEGIIPTTTNIHLMGDSIGVPLMAMAIMMTFGSGFPSFDLYFIFAVYFVLYKFSVAAVPGGGMLVIVPIIEQYLHFTPEMTCLITAFYILFDPVNTSMNVYGNGVFTLIFLRIWKRLKRGMTFLNH